MPRMTREECIAFLAAKPHTAKIATVRPDGRPHAATIWFYVDNDTIYFTTWHSTVKARNLRHNPNVSIVVDDEAPPFSFVQLEGTAQITESDPEMLKWSTLIAGRYMGEEAEAYGKRNAVEGEWLIRVPISRIIGEKNIAGW